LREEAARLEAQLAKDRLRSRAIEHSQLAQQLHQATTELAETRARHEAAEQRLAALGGLRSLGHGQERRTAMAELDRARIAERTSRERVARLTERHREVGQHERRRAVWAERHQPELQRQTTIRAELAWRQRAAGRAAETELPGYLTDFLGPRPDSVRGARRWRQLAAGVADYRNRYGITEQDRALGPAPKTNGLAQRRHWRELRGQAERLWQQQRGPRSQDRQRRPSHHARHWARDSAELAR
jgi:hypothetical protein